MSACGHVSCMLVAEHPHMLAQHGTLSRWSTCHTCKHVYGLGGPCVACVIPVCGLETVWFLLGGCCLAAYSMTGFQWCPTSAPWLGFSHGAPCGLQGLSVLGVGSPSDTLLTELQLPSEKSHPHRYTPS